MTTTDPGAIDLHDYGSRNCNLSASNAELREDGVDLIAAVEALRDRVAEMEAINIGSYEDFQLASGRAVAAEARAAELRKRVAELEGELAIDRLEP